MVLGAQGKQLVCYTNVKKAWTPPRAPAGGGFGCEQYSLGYLYEEYRFRRNIWTKSNINRDLCRYLGCRFAFYRHYHTDFVISFDRMPPFTINELTYASCHPQNLLLGRHKKLLLSYKTKPNGPRKKIIKIKPPKQMISKWFFQEHFAEAPLCMIKAAACNFRYSHLGCCNKNSIVTFYYLNLDFYKMGNWAATQTGTQIYQPYLHIKRPLYGWINKTTGQPDIEMNPSNYDESISYTKGYFSPKWLQSTCITDNKNQPTQCLANIPCNTCRYNPNVDTGKGNFIWLHSTIQASYEKPTVDKKLILSGLPLWMMLYGWLSYIQSTKPTQDFFLTYCILLQSPALKPYTQHGAGEYFLPLDTSFINGKAPYDEVLTSQMQRLWFPNIYNQLEVLNEIVCSGPYIPKLGQDRESTWELDYYYQFYFKWGGPEITDPPITDPQEQPTYNVPDTFYGTIQVRNPYKQKFDTLIHPWEYRRGLIKESTLKRMQQNLSIDTDLEEDAAPPKKKRKITGPQLTHPEEKDKEVLQCLQELCKENTYQETEETQNLQLLIKQQQEQQQQLRRNILTVLSDMKEQQRLLQLQAGFLN